jgi:cobalt-zinc-cadmium efflux system outer membrane protein
VQRLELSLRSRFAAAFERYSTARTTAEEYGTEILPQSYEAFTLYADAFRKHNAAYPQVLIAQRSYFEASVDYLDALSELRTAEVELNGLLLTDGLTQPEPHGVTSPEPPGLPVRSLR